MSTFKPQRTRKSSECFKIFEYLFDNSLGICNTYLVDLELKGDVKTVCSQPYQVLRVHEAMFIKEVERMVKLGLL